MEIRKKVFVGLSGGVDSAVSAALLRDAGYDVTGCFIRGWHPDYLTCTWKEDRRDAMRVAASLDIKFIEFDASTAYKKLVVDEMTDSYNKGLTPNPDILCNEKIKFGVFYDFAMANGADLIATGHYARSENGSLLMSADSEKDQTYFLWAVPQGRIAKTLFPIGSHTKKKVRKLAQKYRIPVSDKKDSQGVCFLGQLDLAEFMGKHLNLRSGIVEDTEGNQIGTHKGIQAYTIGQRHGFNVSQDIPDKKALYVIHKDITRNVLIVGRHEEISRQTESVSITHVNIIGGIPKVGENVSARIRHRGNLHKATIQKIDAENASATLQFTEPIELLSEGQSVVMYMNNRCIGGGIISGHDSIPC